MKIKELYEEDKNNRGLFVAAELDEDSRDLLVEYCKKNKIQNPLAKEKFHSTILFSRKPCPDYRPSDEPYPMSATVKRLEMWKSVHVEGQPNCLVMKLDCPALNERFDYLMNEHDASYDFDEYLPHVTLSYDAGDIEAEDLPTFDEELIFDHEKGEPLKEKYDAND
jgi:2'-5' RNA ligase